jgi:small multidrug resistance pump
LNDNLAQVTVNSVSWMKPVLLAAAAYNLAWGSFVVLFPAALFTWFGMEPPNYPELWQCIGMIVGVYGIGYGIAAFDPARHWPIVLVGFLGKLFGPVGFLQSALQGRLPWRFGWLNVTNDLIWLVPFALILLHAWRANFSTREGKR